MVVAAQVAVSPGAKVRMFQWSWPDTFHDSEMYEALSKALQVTELLNASQRTFQASMPDLIDDPVDVETDLPDEKWPEVLTQTFNDQRISNASSYLSRRQLLTNSLLAFQNRSLWRWPPSPFSVHLGSRLSFRICFTCLDGLPRHRPCPAGWSSLKEDGTSSTPSPGALLEGDPWEDRGARSQSTRA